jgi:hypothetical protein
VWFFAWSEARCFPDQLLACTAFVGDVLEVVLDVGEMDYVPALVVDP